MASPMPIGRQARFWLGDIDIGMQRCSEPFGSSSAASAQCYYFCTSISANRYRIRLPDIPRLRTVSNVDHRDHTGRERDRKMNGAMVKRTLAIGLAGVITAVTAAGAIAKVHKGHKSDKYTVTVAAKSYAAVPIAPVVQLTKICWRYYGGPKGGMWPGPCPQ
jgi:hypothetical protein